tara:strand:- start:317 stop:463 length:147 start_codon:yes stop_codon:yes gene_type:complete
MGLKDKVPGARVETRGWQAPFLLPEKRTTTIGSGPPGRVITNMDAIPC